MAASAHDARLVGGSKARTILRLNGIAAVTLGGLMLIVAGPLAGLAEVGRPAVLAILGAILFGYGFDELAIAVGRRLRRAHVWLAAVAGVAWLAGAYVFVLAGPEALTFLERSLIAASAIVVGWFALAEIRAARSL